MAVHDNEIDPVHAKILSQWMVLMYIMYYCIEYTLSTGAHEQSFDRSYIIEWYDIVKFRGIVQGSSGVMMNLCSQNNRQSSFYDLNKYIL